MNTRTTLRTTLVGGAALLLVAVAAGLWWQHVAQLRPAPPPEASLPPTMDTAPPDSLAASEGPLPTPPLPPRVAQGQDYDQCMAMLANDPAGANAFADAWEATGGGIGATQCHAFAQIDLGNADTGAKMLDTLGATASLPLAARAAVYGQAGQAWLVAGMPDRAIQSDTLALGLAGDDPDLLIGRSAASATMAHYQDAVDDLTRALAVAPMRADALVLRAAGWRLLNHLDRAGEDIDRAITLDPDNADALLERGILRQRNGLPQLARIDWQRAIALAPDTPTADLAQQNLDLLEAGPDRR